MAENALIRVLDESAAPVEGLTVTLYDSTNTNQMDQGQTDAAGEVTFLALDEETFYYLRFYGKHILATPPPPQRIKVKIPPPSNLWVFTARIFTTAPSPNPSACRCWGHFVDGAMRPLSSIMLRLAPVTDPAAVNEEGAVAALAQKPLYLAPDAAGLIQVDLVRGGLYQATMTGYLDQSVQFRVPNSASINLIELLFPVPLSGSLSPAGPLGPLGVGGTAVLTPSLLMSDGRVLTTLTDPAMTLFLLPQVSDDTVLRAHFDGTQVKVTGLKAGAATVTLAVLTTYTFPRVPAAAFTITPVSVTV